jgi:hypothetical protein
MLVITRLDFCHIASLTKKTHRAWLIESESAWLIIIPLTRAEGPSGYDKHFAMVFRWPIEIDGLPFLKMVDLSMANC